MKRKNIIAAAMIASVIAAAVPVIAPPGVQGLVITQAEAARGGARIAPRRAPAAPKSAPSSQSGKSVSGNGDTYAPSKSASQLDKNAPAAGTRAAAPSAANTANAARSSTGWGNALRSVGLLAGGMLLGSMLASMFGLGEGFLADLLGVLANAAMLMAAFIALRWLWNRLRGRREENVYQSAGQPRRAAPKAPITDIRPPGASAARASVHAGIAGESPRIIADHYRNR